MSNRRFTQFFNTLHNKPILLDCNFLVDAANTTGKGISSLKGPGIQAVYMNSSAAFTGTTHTSTSVTGISDTSILSVGMLVSGSGITAGTTIASIVSATAITLSAATGSSTTTSITYAAVGSPNPPAGYLLVKLQDCYNRYFSGFAQFEPPVTGSSLTSTTAGTAYVITTLGTATLAQWQARGLPVGITPAIGVAFVATTTGSIGNSGAVKVSSISGVSHIEVVGDPNQTIISNAGSQANILGVQSGAYLLMKCVGGTVTMDSYTPAGTNSAPALTMDSYTPAGVITNGTPDTFAGTPAVLTGAVAAPVFSGTPAVLTGTIGFGAKAPNDGTLISLGIYLSSSSIMVQGG